MLVGISQGKVTFNHFFCFMPPKLDLSGMQLHQLDVKRFSPDVSGEETVQKYL